MNKHVYALRVFNRANGKFVAVYGAYADDVLKQDKKVYAQYPMGDYLIQRLVNGLEQYADWTDAPAPDAPAQVWAEFIWTPGGN